MKNTFSKMIFGAVLFSASQAVAADIPPFLANGETYVTDTKACADNADTGDSPVFHLSRDGLFGYEFGCTFVQFLPVADHTTPNEPYAWIAIASCGDDSGISRPNMINFTPSEGGVLYVTSQNDYLSYLQNPPSGEDGAEDWSLVERQFDMCK
jgi:hypothetical protein